MKNLNDEEIPNWIKPTANTHKPYVPLALIEKIADGTESTSEISKDDAQKLIEERIMAQRYNDSVMP